MDCIYPWIGLDLIGLVGLDWVTIFRKLYGFSWSGWNDCTTILLSNHCSTVDDVSSSYDLSTFSYSSFS